MRIKPDLVALAVRVETTVPYATSAGDPGNQYWSASAVNGCTK